MFLLVGQEFSRRFALRISAGPVQQRTYRWLLNYPERKSFSDTHKTQQFVCNDRFRYSRLVCRQQDGVFIDIMFAALPSAGRYERSANARPLRHPAIIGGIVPSGGNQSR